MATLPRRHRTVNRIPFVGTGTSADDARFAAAVVKANAANAILEMHGTTRIETDHILLNRGMVAGSRENMIEYGPNGRIQIGNYLDYSNAASIAINPLATGKRSAIEGAAANALDNVGNYLIIAADNEIQDVYGRHRHISGVLPTLVQTPMRMVRVLKRIRTGVGTEDRNQIEVDGYLHDVFTTNPRVIDLNPIQLNGFILKGINFTSLNKNLSGTIADNNSTAFAFYNVIGLRIEECNNVEPAAGQIALFGCYDWKIQGCRFETKLNPDLSAELGGSGQGYGVSIGVTGDGVLEDNYAGFMRHFFTTTGGPGTKTYAAEIKAAVSTPYHLQVVETAAASGVYEYWDGSAWQTLPNTPQERTGQPRGVVRNNVVHNSFSIDGVGGGSSHPAIDVHAEGDPLGIIIEDNTIYLSQEDGTNFVPSGIQSRARGAIIRRNKIISPPDSTTKPISDRGHDTVIEGNDIDGTQFMAIEIGAPAAPNTVVHDPDYKGSKVITNVIRNAVNGIQFRSGCANNHTVQANKFEGITTRHIYIEDGSAFKINDNIMPYNGSAAAVEFPGSFTVADLDEYVGNNLEGYPECSISFDISTPAGRDLDAAWRTSNVSGNVKIVNMPTHALDPVDDLYSPVLATGALLDDVAAGQIHIGLHVGHDGDGVCVRPYGSRFRLPTNYLDGTYNYNPATTGLLWWDESGVDAGGRPGKYTPTTPGDSEVGPVLRVLDQFATEILVEVIDPNGGVGGGAAASLFVDTYADLFLLTPEDGDIIHVQRYTTGNTAGDDSGQLVKFELANTDTIDGGLVFPGPGGSLAFSAAGTFTGNAGSGGRWIALDKSQADLAKFGALVGADSRTSVINAFDAAIARSIPVVASDAFTVASWTAYAVAAGQQLTIKGETPSAGLTLTGTAATLVAQNGGSVVISDFAMSGFSYSVLMSGTLTRTEVSSCTISSQAGVVTDTGQGTATCADFVFTDNTASTLTESMARYRATTLGRVKVTGNTLNGATSGTQEIYGIVIGANLNNVTAESVDVRSNTLKNLTTTGAFGVWGILLNGPNTVCNDNKLDGISTSGGATAYGIYTKCLKGTVSNNHLRNAGYGGSSENRGINCKGANRNDVGPTTPFGYGARVTANTVVYDGVTPTDNACIEIWRDESVADANHVEGGEIGVLVLGDGSTAIDNIIVSCSFACVYAFDASHVSIYGNHILDVPDGSYPYLIASSALSVVDVHVIGGSLTHNGTNTAPAVRISCESAVVNDITIDNVDGSGYSALVQPGGAAAASIGRVVIKSGCVHDGVYYSGVNAGMTVEGIQGIGDPNTVVVSATGGTYRQIDDTEFKLWFKGSGLAATGWVLPAGGGGINLTPQTLIPGTNVTYDYALGQNAEIDSLTNASNTILNISNGIPGAFGQLKIRGGVFHPLFGPLWDFGPYSNWVLTANGTKMDIISWSIDSSGTIHATVDQNFANTVFSP